MAEVSCALLVVSCDAYRDLWAPFFNLFWRNWPDCPFPIYLGSNHERYADERVQSLNAGKDQSWSKNLKFFLERLDSEYVLLLLEDFFLDRPVSTVEITKHLHALHELGGTVLRLYPHPRPNIRMKGYESIGSLHRFAPYRVSTQAALWNRTELLGLLREDESAWEFETGGTIRSRAKADGFLCSYAPVLSYCHVIEQGEWFRFAKKHYEKEQIGCDFTARPVIGRLNAGRKRVRNCCKWVLDRGRELRLRMRSQEPFQIENQLENCSGTLKLPIRVAFLTNLIPPYHKPVLDLLAERFEAMRVLLSTPMESNRPWKLEWDGLDVIVQKTITLKGLWRHPQGFREPFALHLPVDTVEQLRRFKADVVISSEMGFRTALAVVYRQIRRNSKLIVWAEVAESTEQGRGWTRGVLRTLVHRYVDAFLVVGDSGIRYIQSLGVDKHKISKLSYTTDVLRFAAVPLVRGSDRAKRLLFVGQIIERKGLAPFLNALSNWASANGDRVVDFVFAGDGALRGTLQQTRVPPNVMLTFLGSFQYDDLPKVYGEAGILVLPTLADTWGVVVNEAMAAGLPVLGSTYAQAVTELVKDGENGWTFRTDDARGMYDAIDRSMNTPAEKLQEMRECARKTALKLTPAYVADLITKVICACVNDSH